MTAQINSVILNGVSLSVIPPPAVTFIGDPLSVTSGNSSTLTWTSTGATSVTASGDWSGSKALNGNEVVGPLTGSNKVYGLTFVGPGGSTYIEATIAIVTPIEGEVEFITPVNTTWIVPAGVTSICVVCVGGGGGSANSAGNGSAAAGGGALAYVNNISVTPGESLNVLVSAGSASTTTRSVQPTRPNTTLSRGATKLVSALGGRSATVTASIASVPGAGGTVEVGTGGSGGSGANTYFARDGGGGGAGGYSGAGGRGGGTWSASSSTVIAALSGVGGAAAGGSGATSSSLPGGGGGGTGIYGEGASGVAASSPYTGQGGQGGSPANGTGTTGTTQGTASGGFPGGGAGCYASLPTAKGGDGAMRIIWGPGRSFPSNAT